MFGRNFQICLLASVLASATALVGCRSQTAIRNVADALVAQPDPTVELLESELRWMEDNLYQLDDQLETCLTQLDSARRHNAALRLELAAREESSPGSGGTNRTAGDSTASDANAQQGPFDEEKSIDDEELLDFESPVIELGDSANDASEEARDEVPADDRPRLPGDADFYPSDPPLIEPSDNPFQDDRDQSAPGSGDEVRRIQLNPRLTGGYDFDGHAGHDGIMVVIETQDASSRYLPAAGDVTIELRDPQRTGALGQIGKWNFSAAEVATRIKKTPFGKGVHLQLPWSVGSPTTELLELHVTFEASPGRPLKASRQITVRPTTTALVNQADVEVSQPGSARPNSPTASRWKPTR